VPSGRHMSANVLQVQVSGTTYAVKSKIIRILEDCEKRYQAWHIRSLDVTWSIIGNKKSVFRKVPKEQFLY
jgi:hypothetical protein